MDLLKGIWLANMLISVFCLYRSHKNLERTSKLLGEVETTLDFLRIAKLSKYE